MIWAIRLVLTRGPQPGDAACGELLARAGLAGGVQELTQPLPLAVDVLDEDRQQGLAVPGRFPRSWQRSFVS